MRRRRQIAHAFEIVLRDAHDPPGFSCARVPVHREQVLDAETEIERLIERLRDKRRPPRAAGVLLALDLLADPRGPLFEPAAPKTLRVRVRVICEAAG